MRVTADDLEVATSTVVSALAAATDRDWSAVHVPAVRTDCWHEGEHLGDTLVSYAGQLAAQPPGRYVRFVASADKDASAAEVHVGAVHPWAALLWATGRADLPGRDRVGPGWRWRGAPLDA